MSLSDNSIQLWNKNECIERVDLLKYLGQQFKQCGDTNVLA